MDYQHHDTPTKAKIQGAVEFCEKQGIPFFKEDVFRTFGVSHAKGYKILNENESSRRRHNNFEAKETRGHPTKITPKDIREMERILEEEGIEARALTWEQLGYEIGLEVSGRTIQRAMGIMDFHKCIACKKG